ncbi:MAG: hypothetical protein DBX91_03725 [Subdoligranulum variabile]|nr:MAG: hypothetical protein DBX91_03725 [Subdoligranulum variabile]
MQLDDPARALLAEQAAGGQAVLPRLRLIWLGEALSAPPPRRPLELNAELEALAAALQESVRRRPGWFYFAPAARPAPAAVPRSLLQAAVLCWMEGVLEQGGSRAVLQLDAAPGAAVLVLRGGLGRDLPPDARSLLLRLAAVCGGAVVQSGGPGPFTAALRLPLHTETPVRRAPEAGELLQDRYSPLQVFLPGYCAGPDE